MTIRTETGLFVVSIDVEMAWGRVHHGEDAGSDSRFDDERRSVAALLDLMERHNISSTWAVVGHLFLEGCKPGDDVQHPEVRRAPYPWFLNDWFANDPATSVQEDPAWYAPDLVEAIKACRVHQEIGSHSFSHQIMGDPACDADTLRSELTASREAAGTQLRSFVYPRNSIGHRHVLAEQGFVAYRGAMPHRFADRSRLTRRLLSLVDSIFPTAGSAVHPFMEAGLCNVPQTYLFDPVAPLARLLGSRWWARLIHRRIRQAARSGSLFHLWFHSHDIGKAPDRALHALDELFRLASREREAGRLVNMTMGGVAEAMHEETVSRR